MTTPYKAKDLSYGTTVNRAVDAITYGELGAKPSEFVKICPKALLEVHHTLISLERKLSQIKEVCNAKS
ncbi:hypothetical protein [Vibrio superstes]|uniref:Uncharacterized protein n=1 Tax=Vibrio superstes NBRC 103154 TaxID=1219062 RepID=A0A511QVF5_9VIBR|nr:hypothetical protein [Vibrio superstes]GEM81348.1 hypothetical protein VSU01S_35930 [Vibrio superstes NBRC 103154]